MPNGKSGNGWHAVTCAQRRWWALRAHPHLYVRGSAKELRSVGNLRTSAIVCACGGVRMQWLRNGWLWCIRKWRRHYAPGPHPKPPQQGGGDPPHDSPHGGGAHLLLCGQQRATHPTGRGRKGGRVLESSVSHPGGCHPGDDTAVPGETLVLPSAGGYTHRTVESVLERPKKGAAEKAHRPRPPWAFAHTHFPTLHLPPP